MLSLSSAKAGSRLVKGKSAPEMDAPPLGVVCEARKLVREGGRNGVVGLLGTRFRELEDVRGRPDDGGCCAGVVEVAILRLLVSQCSVLIQCNCTS